jgi:hypothetical protein
MNMEICHLKKINILHLADQIEQIRFWDLLMAIDNHQELHEHFELLQVCYTKIKKTLKEFSEKVGKYLQ